MEILKHKNTNQTLLHENSVYLFNERHTPLELNETEWRGAFQYVTGWLLAYTQFFH